MAGELLERLLDLGPELPWSDWAMRPEGLEAVVGLVAEGRVEIVECGSGISTVVLARLLRERGGRIHALESDGAWAALVRSLIEAEGLADQARLTEAPLRPHPFAGSGWYEPAAVDALPTAGVDLLLVDGPPAGEPEIARRRRPALPVLSPRLAVGAVVVLDDAERPGERWVLESWERDTPYRFEPGPGGIAVGRRST